MNTEDTGRSMTEILGTLAVEICSAIGTPMKENVMDIGMVYKIEEWLTWWSARNRCLAQGKKMISLSDFKCAHRFCASGCDSNWEGFCHKDRSISVGLYDGNNISSVFQAVYVIYGSVDVWTETNSGRDSCYTYYMSRVIGGVYARTKNNGLYALCRS